MGFYRQIVMTSYRTITQTNVLFGIEELSEKIALFIRKYLC